MGVNAKIDAVGDGVDRRFERFVVEGLDAATGVTDEMVVVRSIGMRGFEARHAIAGIDAGNQRKAVEELERAVDAGDACGLPSCGDLGVDLLRTGTAILLGQCGDDAIARAASTGTLGSECRTSMRLPDGGGGVVVMGGRGRHWLQST